MNLPLPLQFLAASLAVWLARGLQERVDYLRAENRLLREKLGAKRLQLTDAERRRLAMLGRRLGRKGLAAVATIASPETILGDVHLTVESRGRLHGTITRVGQLGQALAPASC
jgi:hypothetical protein